MPEVIKPSNLNLVWADAGDKIKPSDAKIHEGWVVEIPTRQNFNWLDGRQDQAIAHINQRGIPEYDRTTDYIGGKSYTQGSNGTIYFSIRDSKDVDPVVDKTNSYWVEAFISPEGYLGGKRFVGYEPFSTDFTAVVNHRYFLSAPLTVTLPTDAVNGDAVVVATDPAVVASVEDADSNTYSLESDETVFIFSANGWLKINGGGEGGGSVSLNGPTIVTQGTTNAYTITDYNAFSVYTTSTSVGTFTRTGDTISLVVPNPANATQVVLTVTRDGVPETFVVAVGDQSVATPSITYPSEGQVAVEAAPTLSGTVFSTVPVGQDTHQSSQWQVSTNSGFTNIIFDSGTTTTNKTSVQVPTGVLSLGTQYFARVKYTGAIIGDSAWSATRTFTTANQSVITPTVMVTGGPANVGETPTITTSAFAVSSGSDTHSSTDWQVVRASDSTVVWQSLGNTTNKTSIIVPAQILQVGTQYIARVRHAGATAGKSAWGEYNFTTLTVFFVFDPSSAGLPYGGGYYAGANIVVDGVQYALVVAPKAQGGEYTGTLALSNSSSKPNTNSYDGLMNTELLYALGSPSAIFTKGLDINGYNDWYIPSGDELEIIYRYLKPGTASNAITVDSPYDTPNGVNSHSSPNGNQYTYINPSQTKSSLFKAGGVEAFPPSSDYYWTSTLSLGFASPRGQARKFENGYVLSTAASQLRRLRAVRRVPIPT